MKVVRLYAENVKRLRAVEVRPKDAVVVVGGKNDAGKSSLLDAIEMAMAGKRALPPQPLRKGAAKGRVVLELDDIIVTRTFKADGSTQLKVENKDGRAFSSPQAVLDKLYGALTFDPLAFERAKPEEQAETLQKLVGLDFRAADEEIGRLYDERTLEGRSLKALQVAVDSSEPYDDAPAEEVSVAAIAEALAEAERLERLAVVQRRAADLASNALAQLDSVITQEEHEIERLEKQLSDRRASLKAYIQQRHEDARRCQEIKATAIAAEAVVPATEPLRAQLQDAEVLNQKVRNNRQHAEKVKMRDDAKARVDELTQAIQKIEQQKAEDLAAAPYPVPGLAISEAGQVLLNDLPFEQASTSDRVRVSVAMGLALNPKLRVLLVRDGSLIGSEKLRIIEDMVRRADAQLWIEMMQEEPTARTTVFIEEGQVAHRKPKGPQLLEFDKA